jgi:hypothetical protein
MSRNCCSSSSLCPGAGAVFPVIPKHVISCASTADLAFLAISFCVHHLLSIALLPGIPIFSSFQVVLPLVIFFFWNFIWFVDGCAASSYITLCCINSSPLCFSICESVNTHKQKGNSFIVVLATRVDCHGLYCFRKSRFYYIHCVYTEACD